MVYWLELGLELGYLKLPFPGALLTRATSLNYLTKHFHLVLEFSE